MVEFLEGKDGKSVKIGEVAFAAVFNTLANICFSKDFIDLKGERVDSGLKGVIWKPLELGSTPNIADFYPIFDGLDPQGADTTTSTIEWAMTELVKNKEVMGKLRTEPGREIGTADSVKESHLSQLPYLHACIKETLRLHPPVPFLLPHRALDTCEVMNYTIPFDSQVIVNAWAIGRDPMVWKEPLSFKPERFLDSEVDFRGQDFE
ncbi:hypothetical protein RJ639_027968 [Escallonia herrerae]|uniref:Cytochrome P450 n=1 Tax=Escallonia herrerae TaxID=1293975 RepID=A0AA88X4P1_9ASTE|nr:hypothetical protein RJ639_027968 [Escallonia herrerae]